MGEPQNLGSFIAGNKDLVKEYLETRLEIYRLQTVRVVAKSAGLVAWIFLSLLLGFLFLFFCGLMLGCWFAGIFHSYVTGFGLVALLILAVFILVAIFRRSLFVNPVIQAIIQKSKDGE
ncbi:MAG TPA: hypothetical protein VKU83_00725 [Puia sp.]|nr:hypothetical protein [Puia sp.]